LGETDTKGENKMVSKKRIREIQKKLKKIKITPEEAAEAYQIGRECSRMTVGKMYRPFTI